MVNRYVFADEAGNFDFSDTAMASGRASRYFILTTVTMPDCGIAEELLALRRSLAVDGIHLPDGYFHAKDDAQHVRDRVFELLQPYDFRVDATILSKARTYPYLRDERKLYKLAWYLHFKHVAPRTIIRRR